MKKILVIDDSEEIRDLVTLHLETEGYQVAALGDAREAEELCQTQPFDVVICDLVMPLDDDQESESAMSGLHVIHSISKTLPHVPVIAISGQMQALLLDQLKIFGARLVLAKPFSREQLLAVVAQALQNAP